MNSLLNKRRVVVTGLGLISPIGIGVAENWANLNGEKSGFVTLPSEGNL
jgi:3-oxoacyl-[acyl-carrier-protein] synthase II